MLKKYLFMLSKVVAIGAFLFATFNANSSCVFIYQSKKVA